KTFMPIESLFEKTGKFDGWLFEDEPCGNNGWSGRCCALRFFLRKQAGDAPSKSRFITDCCMG
ncbi:hypothetical protein, partial [Bilophila wadsworthia]|uniref:hypothetical protein n=1 Tax=Bilophila wadsworthia TaxID=35833 RepID=UPI0026DBA772